MKYQAVIHCGIIRQTAAIENINQDCLRTGDKAIVRFRFMVRPEFFHPGSMFVFREGSTKGIGRVVRLVYDSEIGDNTNTASGGQLASTSTEGTESSPSSTLGGGTTTTTTEEGGGEEKEHVKEGGGKKEKKKVLS